MADRARMIEVAREIQRDAHADAHRIDGTSPSELGPVLGDMLASIDALARLVETILRGEVEG